MEEGKVHVGKSLSVVVEFVALSGLPYSYRKIIDYMVIYRGKDKYTTQGDLAELNWL